MSDLQNLPYNACLNLVTSFQCNLECEYCIAGFSRTLVRDEPSELYTKMDPINISPLINTLNDSNKIYKINFTGGEPFLTPNMVEFCIELTKRHFIAFNTNLTPKKVEEFAEKINPERVYFIIASCHVKELERKNLLSRYIHNFFLLKNRGFPMFAVEVGYPPLLKEVDKFKKFFLEKGIDLKFCPFIGDYKGKHYPESYSGKELKILGLKEKDVNIFHQHKKLCNAGYNMGVIYPNGDICYCYQINESLGSIYDGIKFKDKLIRCPVKFCDCPMNMYELSLYKKAISDVGSYDSDWIQLGKSIINKQVKNLLYNYLTDNTRKLILETFMKNKFTRNYLLKHSFTTK